MSYMRAWSVRIVDGDHGVIHYWHCKNCDIGLEHYYTRISTRDAQMNAHFQKWHGDNDDNPASEGDVQT